jgi:hypothetical protein
MAVSGQPENFILVTSGKEFKRIRSLRIFPVPALERIDQLLGVNERPGPPTPIQIAKVNA